VPALATIRLVLAAARDEWLPAVVVGGFLVLLGGWFLKLHVSTWRRHLADSTLDANERAYLRRQFLRRMQASGLIVLIGILLPVGDQLLRPERGISALGATLYWLTVLGLTCWVLLLAMADMVSTRAHSRAALSRIQQKQRELQAEADRLRAVSRGEL
jgi:signal transduction histidine kinase